MTDKNTGPKSHIPVDEVKRKVREVVAAALQLELDKVQLSDSLFELGAESLDLLDMVFRLEKEYRIQFPHTDILERATQHFGEDALVSEGVVTNLGLELMRKGMPELDSEVLKPGLLALAVAQMIQVESFARITIRLLEAKAAFLRICPDCSGVLEESEVMPEFVCSQCGKIVPLPSGDEILLQDVVALIKDTQEL